MFYVSSCIHILIVSVIPCSPTKYCCKLLSTRYFLWVACGTGYSACLRPVKLLWNCTPVLKRRVAISTLSVWISVPCGAMPSLRAPLLVIFSSAPDSLSLLTQWPLCSYIYYCCGTLPCVFGSNTQSNSSYPSGCRFIGEKCNWIEEKCSETGTWEEACRN